MQRRKQIAFAFSILLIGSLVAARAAYHDVSFLSPAWNIYYNTTLVGKFTSDKKLEMEGQVRASGLVASASAMVGTTATVGQHLAVTQQISASAMVASGTAQSPKFGAGTATPETGVDSRTSDSSTTYGRFGVTDPIYVGDTNPFVGYNMRYFNGAWRAGSIGYTANNYLLAGTGVMTWTFGQSKATAADQAMTVATAMTLDASGALFVTGNGSFLSLTDRTESPEDATTAIELLSTMQPEARPDGTFGVDYDQLAPELINESTREIKKWRLRDLITGQSTVINSVPLTIPANMVVVESTEQIQEKGRNLTMTVSATALSVTDHEARIKKLEEENEALRRDVNDLIYVLLGE